MDLGEKGGGVPTQPIKEPFSKTEILHEERDFIPAVRALPRLRPALWDPMEGLMLQPPRPGGFSWRFAGLCLSFIAPLAKVWTSLVTLPYCLAKTRG